MTATIIDLQAWKRTHATAHCQTITLAESLATQHIRWCSAAWRDWLRAVWGV